VYLFLIVPDGKEHNIGHIRGGVDLSNSERIIKTYGYQYYEPSRRALVAVYETI
jgi:hypothetical protein